MRRETGPTQLAPAHTTTFYVMAAGSVGTQGPPAKQMISEAIAGHIVDLIIHEGEELAKILKNTGIISGEFHDDSIRFNLDKHKMLLCGHCAVMTGHLPQNYWPRIHRRLDEESTTMLCTCPEFALHAECEHQVFVMSLQGQINFEALPAP